MDVSQLSDEEVIEMASRIRAEGRPNPFAGGNPSHEEIDAVLARADSIGVSRAQTLPARSQTFGVVIPQPTK